MNQVTGIGISINGEIKMISVEDAKRLYITLKGFFEPKSGDQEPAQGRPTKVSYLSVYEGGRQ